MKRAFALLIVAFLLLTIPCVKADDNNVPYPTVTIYFSDGSTTNITGALWASTIFPVIEGFIKSYNWQNKIRYLFFDSSLKGLNPYGLDFVRALEKYSTLEEYDNNINLALYKAFNATKNMDSDGDGYTNIEELNAGTYPGDPTDYPGKNEKTWWQENEGYIVIGGIIGATFVLYFVFNREDKE